MSKSEYYKALSKEDCERYLNKLTLHNDVQLPDPYSIKDNWLNDISNLPPISWRDVTEYLIDTPSVYTKESLKAYKSLEAYNYFVCGHVHECFYHHISPTEDFCFIKSEVLPSQRQAKKTTLYRVWVCLNKVDGWVLTGNCTCMAGLGSACSHVAALLFKLEAAVHFKLNEPDAPTSQLCAWKKCKRAVEPSKLSEIVFKKPKKGTLPIINHDMDETAKNYSVFDIGEGDNPIDPHEMRELFEINPSAAIFNSIGVDDNIQNNQSEGNGAASDTDSGAENEENCIPEPLCSLFDPTAANLNEEELSACSKKVYDVIYKTYSQKNYDNLCTLTKKQSLSQSWMLHRAGRITASICHQVYHSKDKLCESAMATVMQYKKPFENKYTKYGKKMESTARAHYKSSQSFHHDGLEVNETGFHVRKDKPYLGASPDGVVYCKCHGYRLLEIKCPFKYQAGFENWESDRDFPFNADGNMKENHRYYYQIQLQMLVCGYDSCDFFVFSPANNGTFMSQTIQKNSVILACIETKLEKIFFEQILPEIVSRSKDEMYINERKTYCHCQRPTFGSMIACDNNLCSVEWFHYPCVFITRAPRGKWYCPECRSSIRKTKGRNLNK